MNVKRVLVTTGALVLPCIASAQECRIVGIKPLKEFVTAGQRRCFENAKQARKAGFTKLDSDRPISMHFLLEPSQEVPPSNSTASGECLATLLPGEKKIGISCSHTVADVTAAHIHSGAAGANGSVICGAESGKSPFAIYCSLSDEQVAAVRAGQTYVNVHSTQNPAGEIRGQVTDSGAHSH
jgi:hypothetical protein